MKTVTENTVRGNQKPTKRTYVHNRGTSPQKNAQAQCLSKRLGIRNETKKRLVSLLMPLDSDLSERVERCGAKFTTITCGTHIVGRKPHDKCDFRLCPNCAPRRSRKFVEKYLPKAVAFLKHSTVPVAPVHVVLTLKHRTETAKQARKRLTGAISKLFRRKFWDSHFLGGIYTVEFTLGTDNQWHVHAHIIAFRRRWFDVELLRREWLTVTEDSHVVHVAQIDDVRSGLREQFKYISKPSDINRFEVAHVRQLLELKGQRMVGAFGEFKDFCAGYEPTDETETDELTEKRREFSDGECCPVCSEPLFELILSVDELIRHARRIEMWTIPNKLMELKL
jgi:hypothetical protein